MGVGMTCPTFENKVWQGVARVAVKRPATLPHHPPPKGGGGGGANVAGSGRVTEVGQKCGAAEPRPTLPGLAKQIADCDAKSRFRSRGRALRFINRSGYPLEPYRCVVCGEWHLTKEGKGER